MIHVLHVIGMMGSGGAEALLMNLYRTIDREQVQFDFVVHTNEKGFYDDEIRALGGRIFRTEKFNGFNYFSYKAFWEQFFEQHPEYPIVHGHINSSVAIYLVSAKRDGRMAVVHSHATRSQEKSLRACAFLLFTYPIRYIADYFFACSHQAGIDRFGKKVVDSNRFEVLNNGIQVSNYVFCPEIRKKLREEYHIAQDTLIMGHTGRFTFAKNHDFLIDIFQKLHEKEPNSKLWLIGVGELEDAIQAKIKRLHLDEDVLLIGQTNQVCDYLQAMDVFVFPSIFEGLGIALVEAEAAGLPCVVSENIQQEADIGCGLVKKMNLSDDARAWADEILKVRNIERQDRSQNVLKAGFNINETAQYLQKFYEGLANTLTDTQ